MRQLGVIRVAVCLSWLVACAAPWANAPLPAQPRVVPLPDRRLPDGVRPLAYALELAVLPKQERFSGRTQITVELSAPSAHVWLHGKNLNVTEVHALVAGVRVPGSYQQRNDEGLSSLQFARPLPAGRVLLELRYDAAFDRQLQGLYRLDQGGDSYAFTQFEALSARQAFPCFDEPGFKTPFDLWLTVAAEDVALSNTLPLDEQRSGNYKRIHFAQTRPLPTYLVAWAVGPLDVVETAPLPASDVRATPVPLRAAATKGHGAQLEHALATLAPMLGVLESYFNVAYPYDKLDIVAVPDFAAGAMENAGLITFRDSLLLVDTRTASEGELRRNAFTLAHELAHQWLGDLVTMQDWNDIWLNEAFATWLEYRVLGALHPEYKGELALVEDMQEAMASDSRVTARMIRQPILTTHDIMNAFDSITYSKGGGVIGMFERFLGPGVFQQGLRTYVREHAYANATTEDLLRALSAAAGREVEPAFMSFLTQPGVPLVAAQLTCEPGQPAQLKLQQSRYLPLGSTGDRQQLWQIPVCARYETAGVVRETCSLLSTTEGWLMLDGTGCPAWIMPNADGVGYYRFSLASADLEKLRNHGLSKLSARERYVLLQSLIAGFEAGTVSASDLLTSLPRFAADDERTVAVLPLGLVRDLREHWLGRANLAPALRAQLATKLADFVRRLYGPTAQRLGLHAKKSESGELKLWRAEVLGGMCELANDAATRSALARAGRQYLGLGGDAKLHPEVLPSELLDLAVQMLVEQGDEDTFDSVYERFKASSDAIERTRYLSALSSVRDYRSHKALSLSLDPALRVNEIWSPLRHQLSDYRTRSGAYAYFEEHFDQFAQRAGPAAMGESPWLAAGQCDQAQAERIQAFFQSRIEKFPGGPRSLSGALEALGLCDALVKAQSPALDAFFSKP